MAIGACWSSGAWAGDGDWQGDTWCPVQPRAEMPRYSGGRPTYRDEEAKWFMKAFAEEEELVAFIVSVVKSEILE